MAKDHTGTPWRDIPRDEILDSTEEIQSWTVRYGRIMQQYSIEATKELTNTIDNSGKEQKRQQRAMIALTIVLAGSALVYTWITWQSVAAMRASNDIQRQILQNSKP